MLFVLWFLSGIVMMYVRLPVLTDAERVAHARPIAWQAVRQSPETLFAQAQSALPAELRLQQWLGEPVYRLSAAGRAMAFSAVDGRRISDIDANEAVRVAAEFSGNANARWRETLERDQWTVASRYNPYRPLHRISIPDEAGTELYVSAVTGEVVLDTTRRERFWNWCGAVTHWFYFTALRSDQRLWERVVLWTSGAGIVVAISGLWLGVQRLRRVRYARASWTPYRGWMAWHHLAGLLGGLPLLAWIFSGWLSMGPLPMSDDNGLLTVLAARADYNRRGDTPFPLGDEARSAFARLDGRDVRWVREAGRPVALLTDRDNRTLPFDPDSGRRIVWSDAELFDAMQHMIPQAELIQRIRLQQADRYWYSHHEQRQLPVLRGIFNDAASTWVHVDPTTGVLLQFMNENTRGYRWWFNALHSLDFPWLLDLGPVWHILLLVLSAVGLIIAGSGVVIGWRRLRRYRGE